MFLLRGDKVLYKSLVNLAVSYFQSSILLAGVINVLRLSRAKLTIIPKRKHNRCNGAVYVTRCPSLYNFMECAEQHLMYFCITHRMSA